MKDWGRFIPVFCLALIVISLLISYMPFFSIYVDTQKEQDDTSTFKMILRSNRSFYVLKNDDDEFTLQLVYGHKKYGDNVISAKVKVYAYANGLISSINDFHENKYNINKTKQLFSKYGRKKVTIKKSDLSSHGAIAFLAKGEVVYSLEGQKQKTIYQEVSITIYYVIKNNLVILFDSYDNYIKTIS